MTQPSDRELNRLGQIADELVEVVAERGYRVDVAMDVDPAFGSGSSRSSVMRDLVYEAVVNCAGRLGVDSRPIRGGGRELRTVTDAVDRRYRLRRGRRNAEGELVVTANSESSLAIDADEESMFGVELWAFVWVLSAEGLIEEVVAAEVIGYEDGRPGQLVFRRLIHLGSAPGDSKPRVFVPSDEGLDGFDVAEESDGDLGQSAS